MLDRENPVVFLAAWIDACSLWRLYMPHLNMPGSGFFCFANKPDWSLISGNNIAVVQRCCTAPQFDFIKTCAQLEMKIVYDLDDNVWSLPEYNPAHELLQKYKEGFKACIRIVDAVTVSTKTLAKEVKKHVKDLTNPRTGKQVPIFVTENRIDERLFTEPYIDTKRLIVGWAGSSSHVGDLKLIEDVILRVAAAHPKVMFEFRGCNPPESMKEVSNIRHQYWTPVAEYGMRMPRWAWSIAMAPVTDHEFNGSKSCIKQIEAAYCKIPCLASWVQPYDEFCSWDPELKWLLCAGPSSWERKLTELINDPARREYLGQRMYNVMVEHYSFRQTHLQWKQVFDEVKAL